MHTPPHPRLAFLLKLLAGLSIEGFEKSFKISKNALLEQRLLIGIDQIYWQRKKIFNNCHFLNMPEEHLQSFRLHFSKANRAYFGYEENLSHCTYKVYLEFWNQYAQKRAIDSTYTKPFILYIGYKWNASNNTQNTLTNYTLYPEITHQNILEKIENIYHTHSDRQALTKTQQIIMTASKKTNDKLLKYLEVTEDSNPRNSFDINLYEAGLKIQDIYHELKTMQEYYEVDTSQFDKFYQSIRHQEFGHLSGGINKSNNDFMTFYYEVDRP